MTKRKNQKLSPKNAHYLKIVAEYKTAAPTASITSLAKRLELAIALHKAADEADSNLEKRVQQFFGDNAWDEKAALEELILVTPARTQYESLIAAFILRQTMHDQQEDSRSEATPLLSNRIFKTNLTAINNIINGLMADGIKLSPQIKNWYIDDYTITGGTLKERLNEVIKYFKSDQEFDAKRNAA
jgi:hypothetical protein